MSGRIERAGLLLSQSRHDAALEELGHAFAEDPDDPHAHAMASLVRLSMGDIPEAREHARQTIAAEPDLAIGHYALAQTFLAGNRLPEAREAAELALALDVESVSSYELLATIHLAAKDYDEAVSVADEGLLVDPQDTGCMNVRAQAMARRGDAAQASASLREALQEDPDDDHTHTSLGWSLLHEGDHEAATQHFAEALRIDPENEWAREGLTTALKAKNGLYRLALKWYLWVGSMSSGMQWGLIIGLWLLFRFSRGIGEANPALAPWLLPLQILYGAFCALTWLAEPIFDMLLLFDERGRIALRPRAKRGAIAVTAMMAFGVLNLVLYFTVGAWQTSGLLYAILALITCAPLYAAFSVAPGWPTAVAMLASLALVGIQLAIFGISLAIQFGSGPADGLDALRALLLLVGMILAVAALWGSNALHQAEPRT